MSGAQTSSFYPVNQLLVDNAQQIANQYAPQRNELFVQRAQQEIGGTEIEYAARAAQGLLGLGDEAAMAAAYPGAVASAQQYGFLKNAPSVFPGKARLEQIAAMGTSAEKQYEQQGVASDYQTWLRSRGGGGTQGTVTPGTAPAVAPGGGFTGDREKDRALIVKQESGGDPTVLNYVARQDPTAYARGATASGKYQFVNSTWREGLQLAGLDPAQYPEARQAPEAVQDKVFDAVYGKYGTKPWEKGAKDWVRDEHGNYQIATVRPPAGASGGAPAAPGTPPPYQLAGQPVGPPGTPPAAGMPVPGGQGLVTRPDGTVGTPNAGGLGAGAPPAVVAAPAQPPPAATPAAPVANIPPPPPRLQNGLTADQDKTIRDLEAIPPRNRADFVERQKLIATTEQTYRQHNETVDRQYQSDVRQARLDAQTQQRNATTDARADRTEHRLDQAEARAQQKAADEQVAAGRSYQGTAIEAQDDNILLGGDDGSAKYAGAYSRKAKPTERPDGSSVIPNMTAYDKPTYKGGKGQVDFGGTPDYGAVKTTPPTTLNADQGKVAGYADRIRDSLPTIEDTSPAAMSRWEKLLGKAPIVGNDLVSPEFQQHQQAERNFINATLRRESGATIQPNEFEEARKQYIPQPGDDIKTLALKRQNRQRVLDNFVREAGPGYKPPAASAAPATGGWTVKRID